MAADSGVRRLMRLKARGEPEKPLSAGSNALGSHIIVIPEEAYKRNYVYRPWPADEHRKEEERKESQPGPVIKKRKA